MANEDTLDLSALPLDITRRNAALALEMAELTCANRLRLQQLDEQALENTVRLMQATTKTVEQATDWTVLAALPSALAREQVRIATEFWAHCFGAALHNQQSLGACVAKACSGWTAGLYKSVAGTAPDAPRKSA